MLTYSHNRSKIQSGDVVFLMNRGTRLHRLITYFTRSTHIHVGIAFWVNIQGTNHLMISEANGGAQRRIVNLSHYQDHDMDILSTKHDWEQIGTIALSHLGQVRYGWLQAAYIGIGELFQHLFAVGLPQIILPGEICSEFVANVLGLERNYLSPASLYSYLVDELGYEIRVNIRNKKTD